MVSLWSVVCARYRGYGLAALRFRDTKTNCASCLIRRYELEEPERKLDDLELKTRTQSFCNICGVSSTVMNYPRRRENVMMKLSHFDVLLARSDYDLQQGLGTVSVVQALKSVNNPNNPNMVSELAAVAEGMRTFCYPPSESMSYEEP